MRNCFFYKTYCAVMLVVILPEAAVSSSASLARLLFECVLDSTSGLISY